MSNEELNLELQSYKKKFEQTESELFFVNQKLKESEVQYQHLIDAGTALIWISDTDKLCTYFNNNWLQFTGRTLEQEVGNGWAEGVHLEDFDKCLEIYFSSFDKRDPFEMEYRLRHVSGEYRWLLDIGTPNYSSTGEFIGYIGHCFDISERKKTEIALKESEEKYHSIFDCIQDVYYEASFDGILLEVSPSIEIFTKGQYKREDVIGLSLASFYSQPSDRDSSISKLLEESSFRDYELSLSNKDGSTVFAAVSSSLVYDDKGVPQKITGIIRDITERKMADNAIKESLNLLKEANQNLEKRVEERTEELHKSMMLQEAILQHAGLAIISTSADGIIDHFNKAAEEMLGYKAEEVIGKITPSVFHITEELESRAKGISFENDDNAPLDFQFIRQAIHSSNNRTDEWTYIHKNGRKFKVNLTLSSIFNAEGKIDGYIGIANDISKEKNAISAMLESESKYRFLFENMVSGIQLSEVFVDENNQAIDFNFIDGNKNMKQFIGYDIEEIRGKTIKQILPNADINMIRKYGNVALTGEPFAMEYFSNTFNRHFYVSCYCPKQGFFVAIFDDISDRKFLEASLQKSEADNRAIIQAVPDLMFRIHIDGTFLNLISTNEASLFVPKEAFIGKKINEVLPPVLAQKSLQVLELAFTSGEVEHFEYMLPVQNQNRYFENRIASISEQEALSMIRDITERKEAENTIKLQTAAFESFANAIIITNIDGYIQWANSAFTHLTGYTFDEFIGKRPGELIKSGMQDADFYKTFWSTILEKKVWKGELINRRKDGTVYYEEETISPVLDSEGNIASFIAVKIDISERKKIEEDLRESQEKYRGLSEASFEAIFFSEKGVCIEQNLAAEKMFGYTTEEALTRYGTDWIVPEDRQMVMDNMLSGTEKPYEATALRKDGTTFPCMLQGRMMQYKNKVVRVTSLTDITERKLSEYALAESESMFSQFMDYLPGVAFLKDHDGRLIFTNKYMIDVLGAKDWLGKAMVDLFPNEFGEHLTNDDKDSLTKGYIKIEESVPHINGEIHEYETQKFRIDRISKKPLLGGLSVDITERKKAEQLILKANEVLENQVEIRTSELLIAKELAEKNEDKFKLLFNSSNDPMFVRQLDTNNNFSHLIYVNDIACEKYGYTRDEFFNMYPSDIVDSDTFSKKDIPALNELIEKRKVTFESKHLTKDGKEMNVELSGRFFELEGENVVLYVVRDISDRKKAEKAVIESQRLMAIGEMASSIAHDFNNSLQAMRGNIEVLKDIEKLPDSSVEYLQIIDGIISDVATRVKSLQRFGDTKQRIQEYKLVDLNNIIKDVISQLRPMWKDNVEKVGFNIDIEGIYYDNLIISCNEGELKTVFYNILKNSIESMQIGGKIKIVTTVKENQAIVSIQDTGIGMDEETKLKIFQPFYSTKGFEAGRGLGMSGVFSIINTHGGNINVKYSELGKGTIIELRFPYENQKALIVKKEAAEITTKSSLKLNILIVEDVTSIRENFVKLISLLGHQCVSVESGMKALELMESSVFDIVFTDIGMPEMNGWQLADAIKEKFDGKMTVVVVSGWEVSEEEKQKYGVAFALNKPFAFADLKNIIAKLSTKN